MTKEKAVVTFVVPVDLFARRSSGPSHIDVMLDARRAAVLEKLFMGLYRSDATLYDGRHVDRRADVVRYLLDLASAHIAAEEEEAGPHTRKTKKTKSGGSGP